MSTKIINVLGYSKSNDQFVVKAQNFDVRISKNQNFPELEGPSPVEYILAGFAGCINAVGNLVAKELNIELKSLQIEISGELDIDRYQGKTTNQRAGFKSIEVIVKPTSDASVNELQKWIEQVESRCPVQDNLVNATPVYLNLVKELEVLEVA